MLGTLENQELKQKLKNITFDPGSLKDATPKAFAHPGKRMFPVNTPENTLLSKAYFDGQAQALDPTEAKTIGDNIDKHLSLHNLPGDQFIYKQAADNSTDKPVVLKEPAYMLPEFAFCKVASASDLNTARKLFHKSNSRLQLADRVEFSKNFIKVAKELKQPIRSEEIMKYAGTLDFDPVHTQCALELRSGLARRKGKSSAKFRKLASALKDFSGNPSRDELVKLAHVVTGLDEDAGISEKDYNDFIESPFGVVFTKVASEASEAMETQGKDLDKLSKAEIVGQFGDSVLDIVENPDGSIDYDALKNVDRLAKGLS
jgi:hypothetical protein